MLGVFFFYSAIVYHIARLVSCKVRVGHTRDIEAWAPFNATVVARGSGWREEAGLNCLPCPSLSATFRQILIVPSHGTWHAMPRKHGKTSYRDSSEIGTGENKWEMLKKEGQAALAGPAIQTSLDGKTVQILQSYHRSHSSLLLFQILLC